MKKLFSFKSSSSSGNGNAVVPSPSADKQVFWENTLESGFNDLLGDKVQYSFLSPKRFFGKSQKQIPDSPSFSNSSAGLRRSRSLSSAAFLVDGSGQDVPSSYDQNRSPNITPNQQYDQSSRRRTLTPEKKSKAKRCEVVANGFERPGPSSSSRICRDSSGSSSSCSSNMSSKVVDRYIDGEQLQESSKSKSDLKINNLRNGGGRLPPQVQYTDPPSPTDSVNEKNKFNSCREAKGTRLQFSSRDWTENGFGHESPRMIAKNVIERLSQTHIPRSSSKEFDLHIPITTEDVYGGYLHRCPESKSDVLAQNGCAMDEPYDNDIGYGEDFSGLEKQYCFFGGNYNGLNSSETEKETDLELQRRSKEAGERVLLLSEALEQESFLRNIGFNVSSLVETIRRLSEEKINLALEVSELLQSRIAERDRAREEMRMARAELGSKTKKLETEKHEMQLGLKKELDRRSSDWLSKLEKYRLEEQRLRDRVRELAEQNVSLQREVSSLNEKETENKSMMTYSVEQLKELTRRVETLNDKNEDLRQNLSQLQEKHQAAIQETDCIRRNFEEKNTECKELQKSISRLFRTCSEQEKTIEGLQEGYGQEIEKKHSMKKNENRTKILQMEQMRLIGVELALRREVESCRHEVDSLRHENIDLLNRLKGNRKDVGALTIKLDKEMWNRVSCLQDQGLSMLNDSTHLSSKLIKFIKVKASQLQETQQGLDGQFIVESDIKVQCFKRGIESLARSLQTISTLLQEKSTPVASEARLESMKPDYQYSEEVLRTELKSETLLTNLLREKLYSKELEVERLQAEVGAAVRGNDILRCEVQNAMDNISCLTHRLKDLELQILKKDDNISRLQNDLQESMKELKILRGILPKVSEERDLMWEEVKQYSEKNMLLNSEVEVLKKKIETLDEDVLLKEGQITILKDTLSNNKTFNLLGSPDLTREFLLE
ncbi:macrophage erythroblast attacher-like isoform X1 [Hibiscus syriacus]|uniref:Macrophage erythroblast attacher-like isoform X1 n=1 Tax=Hibiscus syriacus TaxID=106335 RepID=A0A6A2YCH3_HIBSY|nr:MAR-binding filament-like protein 1-1 [Hibiscus syriacus]KAE8670707.1 macrophage erythroblast attacher-like isoform X1 [Hibiscus syriacus]